MCRPFRHPSRSTQKSRRVNLPALANGDPQRCGKDWWCPQQTISQMEDFDNSKSHSVKFSNQSASFVHARILLVDSMLVGKNGRIYSRESLHFLSHQIMGIRLFHSPDVGPLKPRLRFKTCQAPSSPPSSLWPCSSATTPCTTCQPLSTRRRPQPIDQMRHPDLLAA